MGHTEGLSMGEVSVLCGMQRVSERELGGEKRFLGHATGWSDPGGSRIQPVRVRRDVWQGLADSTLLKDRE